MSDDGFLFLRQLPLFYKHHKMVCDITAHCAPIIYLIVKQDSKSKPLELGTKFTFAIQGQQLKPQLFFFLPSKESDFTKR